MEEIREPREAKPQSKDYLPAWEMIAVGFGDVLVLIAFAVIGRANHESPSPQGPVIGTLNTAMPFVVAWLFIGVITGAFSGKAMWPILRVVWRTALAAIIAAPIGVALRAALDAGPELIYFRMDWNFVAVAAGVTMLMLVVWRVIWSRVRRLWWPEVP